MGICYSCFVNNDWEVIVHENVVGILTEPRHACHTYNSSSSSIEQLTVAQSPGVGQSEVTSQPSETSPNSLDDLLLRATWSRWLMQYML